MKTHLKRDPQTVKLIEKWLEKKGNSKIKLAFYLGYSSDAVVTHWINRKNIPGYQRKRVAEFINGDK